MLAPSVGGQDQAASAGRHGLGGRPVLGERVVVGLLIAAPFLIVYLGYLLRVWQLSAFSVSSDELDSLLFATQPLGELFGALATHEPHPPFYYVFLHRWVALTGQSEPALRFPSVLFGTFGVAATYGAGRAVGGRRVGLAAAAIVAASQFSVLHSQEARMYAALQAWAALYLAALVHHLRRPTWRSGAIVAAAGLLAAYTHYHGLLLVALGLIPTLLLGPPRDLPRRLGPFAAIAVAYAPWVVFARRIFLTYRGWMGVVPPLDVLRRSVVAYSVGVGVGGVAGTAALVVLPAFAVFGIAALAARRQWRWLATLLCLGILPLVVVLIGSATGRALYHERYLIVVTPAYAILAGVGLAFLSRMSLARPVALSALVALSVVSLPAYYRPATPPNPDYRAAVAFVEHEAGPGALVVLPNPQGRSIPYYLRGHLPTYLAPDLPPAETVAADLARQLAGRREAWFVRYATDPGDDAIARWLEANAFYLSDRWVSQVHVVTYALAPPSGLIDRPISAHLADGVELAAGRAGPGQVRPGERVLVGFRWSAPGPVSPTTKVSLRLIDPWGQAVVLLDRPLANPGELIHLDALPVWQGALPVPSDAVPGRYRLEARFYDATSGRGQTIADAAGIHRAMLDLGTATVEPADASALDRAAPLDVSALALGSGLYAQRVALAGAPFSQSSHLAASLVWAAQVDQTGPVVPELALRSAAGQIVAAMRRPEAEQPYPLGRLRAGERVREHLDLALRAVAEASRYDVVLRRGPEASWAVLGSIDVAVDPNRPRPPPPGQARADLFDDVIRLVGADVPAGPVPAGSAFTVRLAWHAEGRPTAQYTVFVHLVQGAGPPLAQSDAIPGGQRPTTDWLPGDDVLDEHRIAVPATLPAGEYRLVAGLYEADTGRRASVAGSSGDGQMVELGKVTIGPR